MATDVEKLVLSISADLSSLKRDLMGGVRVAKQAAQAINDNLNVNADPLKPVQQNMERSVRQMRATTANLSFQLNDVLSGIAMGQRPMQIIAQQGGQIVQIFGQMRAAGAGFGATMASLVTGPNLVLLALTAASFAWSHFATEAKDDTKDVNDALKEQLEILNRLREAQGLKPVSRETDPIQLFIAQGEAMQKVEEITVSLTESMKSLSDEILSTGQEEFGVGQTATMNKLNAALVALEAQIKSGNPDLLAFAKMLRQIEGQTGLPDNIKTLVTETRKLAETGALSSQNLKDLTAALDGTAAEAEKAAGRLEDLNKGLEDMDKMGEDAAAGTLTQLEKLEKQYQVLMALTQSFDERRALTAIYEQTKAQIVAAEKAEKYKKALNELQKVAEGPLTEVQKVLEQHKLALDNASTAAGRYAAEMAKVDALSELNVQAVEKLSGSLSGLDEFGKKVIQVEGGGNMDPLRKNLAGTSQAFGPFQFTPGTFVRVVKSLDGFAAATSEQILAQKGNLDLQKRAFDELTRQNSAALAKANIPVTDATRYLAHFLGAGGAVKLLQAPPGSSAAAAAGAKATAANMSVLGGGKTVQDVINWAERKMRGAGAKVDLTDQRESTDLAQKEAAAREEIGKGFDAQIAKQETLAAYARLRADLDKKALETGVAVTAEQDKQAHIEAERIGRLAGEKAGTKTAETSAKTIQDRIQATNDETAALTLQAQQLGIVATASNQKLVTDQAEVEVLKVKNALKAQGIILTDAEIAALQKSVSANINAKIALEEHKESLKTSAEATKQFAQQIGQMAQSAIGGLINDLRNGVEAGEAFNNMLNRIIDSLIEMALQSMFNPAGGGGIGGMFASLLGVGGAAKGGIVGRTAFPRRWVDPRVFTGAPRMAKGGIVGGLRAGEFPIIAHRGEMIVPKAMLRKSGTADIGGSVTNNVGDVNIDMAGTGLVASSTETGKLLGRQIQTAVQVVLVRESRPGGILRKQGTA